MLFLVPFIINSFFELGIARGGVVPYFNSCSSLNILEI